MVGQVRHVCLLITLGTLLSCANRYVSHRPFEVAPDHSTVNAPERVTSGNESSFAADLSPNGAYLVFVSDKGGHKSLWERDISRGLSRQLTFHTADDYSPAISPNGKYVSFVSRREKSSGSVHILRVQRGFKTLSDLFASAPRSVTTSDSIDSYPAWFPDSRRLIFARRHHAQRWPQLYIVDIEEMTPQPFALLEGDHPTVSPDGQRVAYQRFGAIYLYDIASQKETQFTEGGVVQDGHPSFSEDGQDLYFIRYADDTNGDGVMNGEDRGTVWVANIEQHLSQKLRESFAIRPMTSSLLSAYYPRHRGSYLYFSMQVGDALDIFRLPIADQGLVSGDHSEVFKTIERQDQRAIRRFLTSQAAADSYLKGDYQLAGELALLELQDLVLHGAHAEALWLYDKIVATFIKYPGIALRAEVIRVQLELSRLKPRDADKYRAAIDRLHLLLEQADMDVLEGEVRGWVLLGLAKAHAGAGSIVQAQGFVRELRNSYSNYHRLMAATLVLDSSLAIRSQTSTEALAIAIELARKFPEQRQAIHQVSNMLFEEKDSVVSPTTEYLVNARERAEGLPIIPALAHQVIAMRYLKEGNLDVAANEFRQILRLYPDSLEVIIVALREFLALEEASARYELVEAELTSIWQRFRGSDDNEHLRSMIIGFHLRRAETLQRQGEPSMAIKEYRKALAYDDRHISANRGLIDSYFLRGMAQDAIAIYHDKQQQHPGDPVYSYLYGYAVTYLIDLEDSAVNKLKYIEHCIEILEQIRSSHSQIGHVHQTLGWLYQQKGTWLERFRSHGVGRLANSWAITKEFFGFAEADWFENAVDSYLTAFYLSEEGSIDRITLSQNLAESYYKVGNFNQSLKYYMQRLRYLNEIPVRQRAVEAVLVQNAGRAAFNVDELDVAELLQKRSLKLWEEESNEAQVIEALDRLALTLRERDSCGQALVYYRQLYEIFSRKNDRQNSANTKVNMTFCAFKVKEYQAALAYAEEAEMLLLDLEASAGQRRSHDGAIKIDLAGEGSLVKGFDNQMRRILLETIRAEIFGANSRLDLQQYHLNRKRVLISEKRDRDIGRFGNRQYLAAELATVSNQLARHRVRTGRLEEAANLYDEAVQLGLHLRPDKQEFMTRDEWLNFGNYLVVNLQRFSEGSLSIDDLLKDREMLKAQIEAIKAAVESGNLAEVQGLERLARLFIHMDAVVPSEYSSSTFVEELIEFISVGQVQSWTPENQLATLWYSNADALRGDDDADVTRAVLDVRSRIADRPELVWKYLYRNGLHDEALQSLQDYLTAGGTLSSYPDRVLFDTLVDRLASVDDPKIKLEFYRRKLWLKSVEIANRVFQKALPPEFLSFSNVRSFELVEEGSATVLLTVNDRLGLLEAFYLDGKDIIYRSSAINDRSIGDAARDVMAEIARLQGIIDSRIYLATDLSPEALEMGYLNENLSLALSFIPAIEWVGYLQQMRAFTKLSVMHVGQDEAVEHGNVGREYVRYDPARNVGATEFGSDLIHFDYGIRSSGIDSRYDKIELSVPSRELEEQAQGGLGWKELSDRLTGDIALIAFAMKGHEPSDISRKEETFVAAAIAAAYARVPAVLMPADTIENGFKVSETGRSEGSGANWKQFYEHLGDLALEENIRTNVPNMIVIGSLGMNPATEIEYIKNEFSDNLYDAEDAFDDGEYQLAIIHYRRHLYYGQRLGDDIAIDEALRSLVQLMFLERHFEQGFHYQSKLLDRLAVDDPMRGEAIMDAAVLAVRAKKHEQASALLDQAKKFFEKAGDIAKLARVYQYKAINAEDQNDFHETIKFYDESRKLHLRDRHEELAAERLLNIGNVYREHLADYRSAVKHYRQAVDAYKQLGDNDAVARVRVDFANTLMIMGRVRDAIGMLEQVQVTINKDEHLEDWVRNAQILSNAYYQAGLFEQARSLNSMILEAVNDVASPERRVRYRLDATNLLAMLYAKLGDMTRGLEILREGIPVAREYGMESVISLRLSNIGFWLRENGMLDEALEYFQRALAIDKARSDRANVAYDLRNIGLTLILREDGKGAEGYLNEALQLSREVGLAYNMAYAYFGLGDLALRNGRYDDAFAAFSEALTIAKRSYLQDFIWRADAGLAAVEAKRQNWKEATHFYESAIAMIESLRAGLASESSRSGFASDKGVQEVYQEMVLALVAQGDMKRAWEYSERARARAFIDSMGAQQLAFRDAEAESLFNALVDLRARIEELRADYFGHNEGDRGLLAQLTRDEKSLLDQLSAIDPQAANFTVINTIAGSELSQHLRSDSALVQYMVTHESLLIWVVHRGRFIGRSVEVTRDELTEMVGRFRRLVESYSTVEFAGADLAKVLLDPILDELPETVKRLVIVPHDSLHYLSFAALPYQKEFLLDRFVLSYLESATLIKFVPPGKGIPIDRDASILAFGNPDLGDHLDLPFAEREVHSLSRYFDSVASFVGSDATKTRLLKEFGAYDIIHLASHAEYNSYSPKDSGLMLARNDGTRDLLSVSDVLKSNVKAKLVTLSACETGLGQVTAGDEIVGLNRAFFYAGTESIVSSLWRISDVASAVIMKRFYRYLAEGDDKATALRKAQLLARTYFNHPAYWSAFKLAGNDR